MEIVVKDYLSTYLGANYQAKQLFEEKINLSDDMEIILDFNGVKAMGRSFAQQYLSQKLKSDKKVIEINQSEMVLNMFKAVKKDYE